MMRIMMVMVLVTDVDCWQWVCWASRCVALVVCRVTLRHECHDHDYQLWSQWWWWWSMIKMTTMMTIMMISMMIDICYCVNDDDDDASDCTFVLWKIIIFIRRKPIQGTGFVFDSDDDDNRDDEDNDDDDSSDDNVHLLNICQNPQRVDLCIKGIHCVNLYLRLGISCICICLSSKLMLMMMMMTRMVKMFGWGGGGCWRVA